MSGKITYVVLVIITAGIMTACGGGSSSSDGNGTVSQTSSGSPSNIPNTPGNPPNCNDVKVHCVGPEQEFDTSGLTHVELAFQNAIDIAQPGDLVAIRGGTYTHLPDSPTKTFMEIRVSGTAAEPITIEPYAGGQVTLVGFGFPEGTAGPSVRDETLIYVYGDHIRLRNLEIRDSSRWAIAASGSYGLYENIEAHDSWMSNIIVLGKEKNMESNTFRYIESYRSRHGSGIWIVPSASTPKRIRNTLVENSLFYHNGYQLDGNQVPTVSGDNPGGGNSDGIGALKTCQESAASLGFINLCPGTQLKNNITYHNADDGVDVSSGDGSSLVDNISFDNGPEGNKGFKVYADVKGDLTFTGNVALGNVSNGFEPRIVDNGYLYNNTALRNGLHGIRNTVLGSGHITATNNAGAFNTGSIDVDIRAGVTDITNWKEGYDGDPRFSNTTFSVASVDLSGLSNLTIKQKIENIIHQFQVALTPRSGSPLIDAGTIVAGLHCDRADDDTINPMSASADCRHWRGTAPDIGAYEYGASLVVLAP